MRSSFKAVLCCCAIASCTVTSVLGQRGSYAGKRPIGYPEVTTQASELGNRFGEDDNMTIPVDALGDKELIKKISKLPIDQQPFWYINQQHIQAHRENPQTYPANGNSFVDPTFNPQTNNNHNMNPTMNFNQQNPNVNSNFNLNQISSGSNFDSTNMNTNNNFNNRNSDPTSNINSNMNNRNTASNMNLNNYRNSDPTLDINSSFNNRNTNPTSNFNNNLNSNTNIDPTLNKNAQNHRVNRIINTNSRFNSNQSNKNSINSKPDINSTMNNYNMSSYQRNKH